VGSNKNDRKRTPYTPQSAGEKRVPLSRAELTRRNTVFDVTDLDAFNALRKTLKVNDSPVWQFVGGEMTQRDLHTRFRELAEARGAVHEQVPSPAIVPSCGSCHTTFDPKKARLQLTFCVYHANDDLVDTDPSVERRWLCKSCMATIERMGLLLNAVST